MARGGGTATRPIPFDAPNDLGLRPGDKADLWHFDESHLPGRGPNAWRKLGTGTVTPDGTLIRSDPGMGIPKFCCGAALYNGSRGGGQQPGRTVWRDAGASGGDPVDLSTGIFLLTATDLVLPGRIPVALTRTYRSGDALWGPFGRGTTLGYDDYLQQPSADVLRYVYGANAASDFARQPDEYDEYGTLHYLSYSASVPSIMPRQARLDAPGTLHHVMVRGLDRRALFADDTDREAFLGRLAALAASGALTVYAWALLPNHAHLLVRTGRRPLPGSMRSLLTGYAGAFNRRHRRVGHLFQNRYKSIVVDADEYLVELTRYIHLNPLRAKVVADLRALERYPWTGHSALLGRLPRPWQETGTILAHFGRSLARGRKAYRAFVAAGLPLGRRPAFQGGGLVRSLGGWAAVVAQRRTGPPVAADARILGAGAFVEAVLREAAAPSPVARPRAQVGLATLAARMAAALGVPPPALLGATQTRAAVTARQLLAYVWVEHLGRRASDLARALGQTRGNVSLAAKRGAAHAAAWRARLGEWCR